MRYAFSFLTVLVALTVSGSAFAEDVISHKPFDQLLKKYTDNGLVDYAGLKANTKDLEKFNGYVAAIGSAKVEGSRDAKLAFYLNAYNATVIKAVIDRYPLESVMKVDGFFNKITHNVAGQPMTLDHLENKIVRPEFNDARIHFGLVCAATSCPPLRNKAFTEANVQKMLEENTQTFITQRTRVEGNTVKASKLFEWFADDFKANEGSVAKYLAKYLPTYAATLNANPTFVFYEYRWDLNADLKKNNASSTAKGADK
jgi:hypothetical protein